MFCTRCGRQMPEGAKFCVICGVPVAALPAMARAAASPGDSMVPSRTPDVAPAASVIDTPTPCVPETESAASTAARLSQPKPFEPFQKPKSIWTLDVFQWVIMFAGGWALVLVQLFIGIPLLAVGYIFYAIRKRGTAGQRPLAATCDVCGRTAVGYKELRVRTGFLMAYYHYWSRGFLCAEHGSEYARQASSMNLLGMFLSAGGWPAMGPYFNALLQLNGNVRVLPKTAVGEPGVASHLSIASHLYLRGSDKRDWDFSREFMIRAASSDGRPNFRMLCLGGAAAAHERLVRPSKKESLALLRESEELLRMACAQSTATDGLTDEEVSFARALHETVVQRIEKNKKRWM